MSFLIIELDKASYHFLINYIDAQGSWRSTFGRLIMKPQQLNLFILRDEPPVEISNTLIPENMEGRCFV